MASSYWPVWQKAQSNIHVLFVFLFFSCIQSASVQNSDLSIWPKISIYHRFLDYIVFLKCPHLRIYYFQIAPSCKNKKYRTQNILIWLFTVNFIERKFEGFISKVFSNCLFINDLTLLFLILPLSAYNYLKRLRVTARAREL